MYKLGSLYYQIISCCAYEDIKTLLDMVFKPIQNDLKLGGINTRVNSNRAVKWVYEPNKYICYF